MIRLGGTVLGRLQMLTASLILAAGCRSHPSAAASSPPDSAAFAAMQARGRMVMGVDQHSSRHIFEDLPDGGRIVLERPDSADPEGIMAIRTHMRTIAAAFARGNFALPGQVHAMTVPGTAVLSAHAAAIRYQAVDLPRGGEALVVTRDTAALAAVHEFLAFQRLDHHAAGHQHPQ
ncbi:MAG: hypothetical protein ABJC74_10490 [Gemmatimonadota bacterium]